MRGVSIEKEMGKIGQEKGKMGQDLVRYRPRKVLGIGLERVK